VEAEISLPDSNLQRATFTPRTLLHVEQVCEGVWVGDVEIVRGEHPNSSPSAKCFSQVIGEQAKARPHDEADNEINLVISRVIKTALQLRLEKARTTSAIEEAKLAWAWKATRRQEIVSSLWNHMPNSSAGIRNVTVIARDDVKMKVFNCLPTCSARVESDVIAVGTKALVKDLLH
jgi:hypothetical protein